MVEKAPLSPAAWKRSKSKTTNRTPKLPPNQRGKTEGGRTAVYELQASVDCVQRSIFFTLVKISYFLSSCNTIAAENYCTQYFALQNKQDVCIARYTAFVTSVWFDYVPYTRLGLVKAGINNALVG